MAAITVWSLGTIIYNLVSCHPFAFDWNHAIRKGTCVSSEVAPHVAFGAVDLAIDIVILVLPIPLLYKLHVSLADKLALICIFGAGIS
jgi:hypothetical protein